MTLDIYLLRIAGGLRLTHHLPGKMIVKLRIIKAEESRKGMTNIIWKWKDNRKEYYEYNSERLRKTFKIYIDDNLLNSDLVIELVFLLSHNDGQIK